MKTKSSDELSLLFLLASKKNTAPTHTKGASKGAVLVFSLPKKLKWVMSLVIIVYLDTARV